MLLSWTFAVKLKQAKVKQEAEAGRKVLNGGLAGLPAVMLLVTQRGQRTAAKTPELGFDLNGPGRSFNSPGEWGNTKTFYKLTW